MLSPEKLIKELKKLYPKTEPALKHNGPFEMLCAVILSAQCTDARVNLVTPELFKRFGTPQKMAKAKREDIETIIKSTGFYHAKAKSLHESAKKIVADFGGQVPQTMDELLTLQGVARKTANVVLGDCFDVVEGVVVDTHVKRLSYRLGLTKNTDPKKVEQDLMKLFPKKYWYYLSNALIYHGRRVCDARKPNCSACTLAKLCPKNGVKNV